MKKKKYKHGKIDYKRGRPGNKKKTLLTENIKTITTITSMIMLYLTDT